MRYSKKVKILSILIPLLTVALSVASILIPSSPRKEINSNEVFQEYSANKITELLKNGNFILGNDIFTEKVSPEFVYILPTILNIYNKEVEKPTTPRLDQMNDTLEITFVGYKQFKNRGIRILKKVRKSLGKRYLVTLTSIGRQHKLQVTYLGTPWDEEQLASLPVMEASIRYNVDPALLMSLIQHVSDFQINYEKDAKHKGLLALETGTGLEQIFIGAEMLRKSMDAAIPLEETLVKFYPINPPSSAPKNWRKDPMRRSWVEQVLGDVQFYSNNGLSLAKKELKGVSRNRLPAILQPLVPIVGAQAASKIVELPPDSQAAIIAEELDELDAELEVFPIAKIADDESTIADTVSIAELPQPEAASAEALDSSTETTEKGRSQNEQSLPSTLPPTSDDDI